MLRIRNYQDFYTGAMFISFGGLFMFLTSDYERGSGTDIGPGFFPFFLAFLLTILGGVLLVQAASRRVPAATQVTLKPLGILLAVILFSLAASALDLEPRTSLTVGTILACTLALLLGLRSLGLLLLAASLFALLLPSMGLVFCLILLLVLAAKASHESRMKELAVSVVLLTLAATMIFIHGLNLPIKIWPDTDELSRVWQAFDFK